MRSLPTTRRTPLGWQALALLLLLACRAPDPLQLISSEPADGAQLDVRASAIELVFDQPIDPRTLTDQSVQLHQGERTRPVRVSLLPGGRRILIDPVDELGPGDARVSVSEALRSVDGGRSGAWSLRFVVPPPAAPELPAMEGGGLRLTGARITPVRR